MYSTNAILPNHSKKINADFHKLYTLQNLPSLFLSNVIPAFKYKLIT